MFVTVGTTSFDALIEALDSERTVKVLEQRGFTELTLQIGRGTYAPTTLRTRGAFKVRVVEYLPSIEREIARAGLVISHAGAGSVFETLRSVTPLLVVVNERLMDNHQVELAEELAERGCLRWCVADGIFVAIEGLELDGSGFARKAYDPGECSIKERLEELLF